MPMSSFALTDRGIGTRIGLRQDGSASPNKFIHNLAFLRQHSFGYKYGVSFRVSINADSGSVLVGFCNSSQGTTLVLLLGLGWPFVSPPFPF